MSDQTKMFLIGICVGVSAQMLISSIFTAKISSAFGMLIFPIPIPISLTLGALMALICAFNVFIAERKK